MVSAHTVRQNLLPYVKIPASSGPVTRVWHHIASNCIMLNLFEVPVTLLTPSFRLVFHSFDLNIKKITNEKAIQQQKYVMLLQCHIPERDNVILYQAPVCVSCKMIKMDLVCSHVLKGLDSDLRPLCSFLCQLITPDSRHITHICFCCSVLLIFFLSQSMHHLILFSLHLTLRVFK